MIRPLSRNQWLFDALAPAVVALIFLGPAFAGGVVGVVALIGFTAALVVRRWFTLLSLGIAWLTAIVEMVMGSYPPPFANVLIVGVLFATGAHARRSVRWIGLASAVLGAACVAFYLNLLPVIVGTASDDRVRLAFTTVFTFAAALAGFLLSWAVGMLVRAVAANRATSAAARRAEREVVAEQERTRIARDMHDVVAHSLAVVIAQADGARYLRATDPEAVDGALVTIAGTAREALADVRVLLGQLRHDQGEGPQPELADLARLYEQFRAAGLDLDVAESGAPLSVSTSTQLAVYRIVQESLTNALRHGDRRGPVAVRFDWAPGGLHLSAVNAPASTTQTGAIPMPGTGHGLAGMTERAHLVGGRLDAGRQGDRFEVRAWLPVEVRVPVAGAPVPVSAPAPVSAPVSPPASVEAS